MESDTPEEAPLAGLDESLRELRRGYHDRIAELRGLAQAIVAQSADSAATATTFLVEDGTPAVSDGPDLRAAVLAQVAAVDAEVLSLLALEAPVARDLRVILSARDVAHLGELCLGLAILLATSAGRVRDELSADLRDLLGRIGDQTVDVLRHANGAWATLDTEQAEGVLPGARRGRELLRSFFAEVIGLTDVPVDAAVALSRTVRAYERLTDHAVEIADKVLFAVNSARPGLSLDALGS